MTFFGNRQTCIAWGAELPHPDCPVVVENAAQVEPGMKAKLPKLPAVCPCECRTCKTAWWEQGRPIVDAKTGTIERRYG